MNIQILNGDATQLEADALVTLINSQKMWFGGMDGAIQRAGGAQFHAQASVALDHGSRDGDAIYAPGTPERGKFKAVIFVVDDLRRPVSDLMAMALTCALDHGCKTVATPALRCGVAAGLVEKTAEATVAGLFKGLEIFNIAHPDADLTVTFVVYQDPATIKLLSEQLRLPPP